jgi:hypothetical protein
MLGFFPPLFPPPRRNGLDVQVTPRLCFNHLALPVTARNGLFRFPKLNVVGSNSISRSIARVGRPLKISVSLERCRSAVLVVLQQGRNKRPAGRGCDGLAMVLNDAASPNTKRSTSDLR